MKYCYDCLLSSPVSSHGRYQIPSIISVRLHEARSYYVHHAAGRTFSMTIPLPWLACTNIYIYIYFTTQGSISQKLLGMPDNVHTTNWAHHIGTWIFILTIIYTFNLTVIINCIQPFGNCSLGHRSPAWSKPLTEQTRRLRAEARHVPLREEHDDQLMGWN